MHTLRRQSFLLSWNINLNAICTNYNWLNMIYVLRPFSITCVRYPTFFKLLAIKWRIWFSESLHLWRGKNTRQPFLIHLEMKTADSSSEESSIQLCVGLCKPRNAFQQTTQNDQIRCAIYWANACLFVIYMKFVNTVLTCRWNKKTLLTGMGGYII